MKVDLTDRMPAMRLSDQDAAFLYAETASGPMQTAGIAIIDGEPSFREIFEHLAARIHLVPRLRHRLVFVPMNLAHPKWMEDPDFDINNHLVHHEMPADSSIQEALDAICQLNEGVMDRSKPLWKFFIVTGVKDHALILQQAHHAMLDGASAILMSTLLFDFEPDAPPPEPPGEWEPPPLPGPMELISEALQENTKAMLATNLSAGFSAIPDFQDHLRRGIMIMSRFFTEPAITAPWNASLLGPERKLVFSVHELAECREIRRTLGGTINDVVLSVATEGAARYLEEQGEYTANLKFRLMCPVNVRTESETGDLGNRVSAIFPMLPAYSLDLETRHRKVCEETSRAKANGEAQVMTVMQENAVSIPPFLMAPLLLVGTPFDPTRIAAANPPPVLPAFGMRPPGPGINFVLTNVPGVQVPQYIAGHQISLTVAIMMMSGNLGLGITVCSFNQKLIFNLTGEPRLIPNLELLNNHMIDVFNELLEMARQQDGATDQANQGTP